MIIESKHGHKLIEFTSINTNEELANINCIGGGHAVLLYKGNLVVCWNKYRNNWELPGGGKEKGEELAACVIREISEEINQNITELKIQGVSKVFIPRMGKEILWAVFSGTLDTLSEFKENEEMAKMALWDFQSDIGDMDEVDMKIAEFVLKDICLIN